LANFRRTTQRATPPGNNREKAKTTKEFSSCPAMDVVMIRKRREAGPAFHRVYTTTEAAPSFGVFKDGYSECLRPTSLPSCLYDFLASVPDANGIQIPNPNQFFVVGFTHAELGG
jgi:hypothetical protein